MLRYPVKLARDDNGTLLVTAPDFPEVTTFGDDEGDALAKGADAIATAMQGRISDRQEIPLPSAAKRGQKLAVLSALTWAKLELYRAMLDTNTNKATLARRLQVHPPQIDRLLDLNHDSPRSNRERRARDGA